MGQSARLTIEQRYRLRLRYGETPDADIVELCDVGKDGLRRFNQRQTRNGEVDRDDRGEGQLDTGGRRVYRVHQGETADPELSPACCSRARTRSC